MLPMTTTAATMTLFDEIGPEALAAEQAHEVAESGSQSEATRLGRSGCRRDCAVTR